MGLEHYYTLLRQAGLSDAEIYDAQGNAFDVDAFRTRTHHAIDAWLRHGEAPETTTPPLATIAREYQRLYDTLATNDELRPHLATHPGPTHVWANLCRLRHLLQPAQEGRPMP